VTDVPDAVPAGEPRDQIRHVIVLMLENRSFDHMLGYLEHDDPSYPNLRRFPQSCPVDPARPNGDRVATNDTATSVLGADPGHTHEAVMLQMYGRTGVVSGGLADMSGFIRSYQLELDQRSPGPMTPLQRIVGLVKAGVARVLAALTRRPRAVPPTAGDIMKCFSEANSPVLSALAKEYAVLVSWHSSVPGETWPNRNFVHAATSDGTTNNRIAFYENKTIFEQLDEAAQDWGIYHDGLAQVWAFPALWSRDTDHFHETEDLLRQIRDDQLPAYAFVEPDYGYGKPGNSQHPHNNTTNGVSFVAGEILIGTIYNTLVAHPQVFAKTLLLVLYDEHGGLFDHVPPQPVRPPDDKVGPDGFPFDISGVRVPAVAISPRLPKGHISTSFFEHSSVPATVRARFAPQLTALTERDRAANDVLTELPLLASPRLDVSPVELPTLPRSVPEPHSQPQTLDEFQASLLRLAGAVKTQLDGPDASLAPASGTPFHVDPAFASAASQRLLVPGSQTTADMKRIITYFNQPPTS
jgi:phospholipase C